MKILYHHRTKGRGAEGVHIMGLVNAFRSRGHEVSILSYPGSDPEVPEAQSKEGRNPGLFRSASTKFATIVSGGPQIIFEFMEIMYNLLTLWRVGKLLKKNNFDFIYERYSLYLIATLFLGKLMKIPVILEINDSAIVERVRPLIMKRFAMMFEKWAFSNASGLVFISEVFHDNVTQAYGAFGDYRICPNAADIEQFNPDRYDRQKTRAKLGLGDAVVCGYVGAFVEWHGIHWLIRESVEPVRQSEGLILLLVGDGKMFNEVEALVKAEGLEHKIRLLGRVDHDEVPKYMNVMDFAILPDSNTYGSPMKVFEFMAMGVAVIAPDFGPVREVIADNRTGWLFKAGDRKGCVDRLMQVADDKKSQVRIGSAAREYIVNERQWTDNADAVMELVR